MKNRRTTYYSLLVLLNTFYATAMENGKPTNPQDFKKGILDGSIPVASLRDSGEHLMALSILREAAHEQQEKDQTSPRGKKANEVIDDLVAYKRFRNDADFSAQICLKEAAKAINELMELEMKSQPNS